MATVATPGSVGAKSSSGSDFFPTPMSNRSSPGSIADYPLPSSVDSKRSRLASPHITPNGPGTTTSNSTINNNSTVAPSSAGSGAISPAQASPLVAQISKLVERLNAANEADVYLPNGCVILSSKCLHILKCMEACVGGMQQVQEVEREFAGTVRFCGKVADFLEHTLALTWSQRKVTLRREIDRNAMAYYERAKDAEADAARVMRVYCGHCASGLDAGAGWLSSAGSSAATSATATASDELATDQAGLPSSSSSSSSGAHTDTTSATKRQASASALGSENNGGKNDAGAVVAAVASTMQAKQQHHHHNNKDSQTDLYFAAAVMVFLILFAAYVQWYDL